MGIKHITCQGTPYQIGLTHGKEAKLEIKQSIDFYADLFIKSSKKSWPEVQETAKPFDNLVRGRWPKYYEELRGIADGAELDILDIVALNVRTEIAFGLFSDGCTSLYWRDENNTFQGQNWDWMLKQKANVLHMTIHPSGSVPSIQMITEAGIMGKIGLNSSGVAVCFNAIRAKGLSTTHMPVHLGLRLALECESAMEAVQKIEKVGMASSAHMLIGDKVTAIGLEFTSEGFARLQVEDPEKGDQKSAIDGIMNGYTNGTTSNGHGDAYVIPRNPEKDPYGAIIHSNHLLLPHPNVTEPAWLEDSPFRIAQMRQNIKLLTSPRSSSETDYRAGVSWDSFSNLFTDETNFPAAICRAQEGKSTSATLFNIVMDLREKKARVRIGRPTKGGEGVDEDFEMGF